MGFNSESGAKAGKKGGVARWAGKDPATVRNVQLRLAVTKEEYDMITAMATKAGVSRTELLVRSVKKCKDTVDLL